MPSPARADWPCAIDGLVGDSSLHELTIAYAGPSACLLPADALAEGIVGCPTAITQTALDTGRTLDKRLRYDHTGHLIERRDQQATFTYAWAGDQVVSVSVARPGASPFTLRYVESDASVALLRDAPDGPITEMELRFAGARLVETALPRLTRRTTLTWDGPRLLRYDSQDGSQESYWRVMYDCAL